VDLSRKTILITGASGGIGRQIAEYLAPTKANLLLVGRDEISLQQVCGDIIASGGHAETIAADLLSATGRQHVLERCNALPGGLFGLINNAGCNHFALLGDQNESMLQDQIHLNLLVPMLLIRELLPVLQKEQGARIMNIGSTFGSIGYPGYSAYCASKFGLRGFTESLRRELADTDMHVLYFAPRATATSLNSSNVVALNRELGNAMDSPYIVAQQAVKFFLDANCNQLFYGWPEKLFVRINQIFPFIVDGALLKQLSIIKKYARK
jgi:short-subunit dehydrogenase